MRNSIDNIRALPNLDHKIMCGNSLLDEFEGIKLFDDSILGIPEEEDKEPEELKKLKIERENLEKTAKELMLKQKWKELEPVSKKLNELNEYIKKLENKYKKSRSKPFFLWKLYFSDVFRRKNPGFDIVIGNPHYVKEYTNKHVFDGLRNSPYYQGKMDLWYFFGCIGLDLLRNDGIE